MKNRKTNALPELMLSRRAELGLSRREAAVRADLSESRWLWIERSAAPRLPAPDVVFSIARAIEVPPAALVEAAGYPVDMSDLASAKISERPKGEARS